MIHRIFGKEHRFYLMGISIIWIVLFHIYLYYISVVEAYPWWISIFCEGYLGVDIFFFLSAYGLSVSIEKNSVARFYKNRAMRIIPANILFLITLFTIFQRECPLDRILIQGICQLTGISLFKYPEFFSTGFSFDWFTPAIILTYIFFPVAFFIPMKLIDNVVVLIIITVISTAFLTSLYVCVSKFIVTKIRQ